MKRQIVIEIPEQIYLNAKADTLCGADILVEAIKNGTPLPKGHSRLIDANEVITRYRTVKKYENGRESIPHLDDLIGSADTIIEADKENET